MGIRNDYVEGHFNQWESSLKRSLGQLARNNSFLKIVATRDPEARVIKSGLSITPAASKPIRLPACFFHDSLKHENRLATPIYPNGIR